MSGKIYYEEVKVTKAEILEIFTRVSAVALQKY